jgi:hypothetical protein
VHFSSKNEERMEKSEHIDNTEYNVNAVDIATETELLQLCKYVTFLSLPSLC